MKKSIIAVFALTCLAGCGKNDSLAQKAQEPKPAEAQQYRPPTEWTEVDRFKVNGKTYIFYYRAVPSDETVKGIKVETGGRVEDDFVKTKIISTNKYAVVNCEKQIAGNADGIITNPKAVKRLLKFACDISSESTDNKIQETNAAAEVQTPQTTVEQPAKAPAGNALSRGSWSYLTNFPNSNGITTNHIYVDRKTKVGTSSLVMTKLESGNLNGWSLIYRKEADCGSGMLRTVSTVSWYNASGSYAKEAQPSNPDWQIVKNDGDRALINYLCQ